ncbi:hypothetical protein [Streptomyces coeruleorubidus]|uniref:hypothetical protein n=1 Tax=Streptomyces coeruleorubidus TaxID=116188 RepID=UPI0033A2365E
MTPGPAEKNSAAEPEKRRYDPAGRPWPWVSFEDPAWNSEPWEVTTDEDLADAAVRFAIRYLHETVGDMKICRAAALVEEAAKRVSGDVVAEARTQRYSWGRIARQFGVGRTAVQKRFGKWPTPERARTLEDQYARMCQYLRSARLRPGQYEDEAAVRETRDRCNRRRRGYAINSHDLRHKVLPRRRKKPEPDQGQLW